MVASLARKDTSLTTEKLLLEINEAAQAVGLSGETLRRAIKAGELPHLRCGRAIRIPAVSLRQWVVNRTTNTFVAHKRGAGLNVPKTVEGR
ncbi:MAG: DNA-binding protein [Dehalococcoidia bacterium]|nr:DNA-binding protein [Dehalococcoidia bacterium]